jgi:protein TonB
MFDSVLHPDHLPKRRFGRGFIIAAVVHAAVIGFAAWASARAALADKQDVEVKFVKPPPPPPPPPPPAAAENRPKPKPQPNKPVTVVQQAIVAPTVIPDEKPPEKDASEMQSSSGEGVPGGEVGGIPGGIVGGVVDASDVANKPVEFDAKTMKDPGFVSGPNPQYTEKALEKEVQGVIVVKCVVTIDGRIHDCRVIRSLPFMDRAVITALEKRRYSPATQGGRPIEVDYTFKITLRLPD